jgi:hypothetical protein
MQRRQRRILSTARAAASCPRVTLRLPFPAGVLAIANNSFFWVPTEITGSPCFRDRKHLLHQLEILDLPCYRVVENWHGDGGSAGIELMVYPAM